MTGAGARSLFAELAEDLRTHDGSLGEVGFWALAVHRFGRWADKLGPRLLRVPLGALAEGLSTGADWCLGIHLPRSTEVGRRVRLWHHGCMRLDAKSIGDDVHIRPNTTFAAVDGDAPDDTRHRPVIGDGVDIGAGACITGDVHLGAGAFVAANSHVVGDVPAGATVVGVPGRAISAPAPTRARPAPPASHRPPIAIVRGVDDQNPRGIRLGALVAEDFRAHGSRVTAVGFWAVTVHRFGNWRMGLDKPARVPMTALYRLAFGVLRWGWGIDLPYDVKLGRRVRIERHGALVVGARSIGDDVVFRGSAIVGVMRRGAEHAKPTIEDRVEIGPRACVVGNITIGHDSVICANTVVPMNVPPHATVLGVPGRIVDLRQHVERPAQAATPGERDDEVVVRQRRATPPAWAN